MKHSHLFLCFHQLNKWKKQTRPARCSSPLL